MSQVLLENSKAGFILVMRVKSALFGSPPQISVGWVTQDPLNITIHKKVCNMGLKSGYEYGSYVTPRSGALGN